MSPERNPAAPLTARGRLMRSSSSRIRALSLTLTLFAILCCTCKPGVRAATIPAPDTAGGSAECRFAAHLREFEPSGEPRKLASQIVAQGDTRLGRLVVNCDDVQDTDISTRFEIDPSDESITVQKR